MKRNLIIAACVAGAIAAALTTPAAADAPTIVEETLHRSIPNFVSCPGFTVTGEFDIDRTVFTFTDNTGTPIRLGR
jgi:hypothetical protein